MSRQYVVIGAGRFGTGIAMQLSKMGEEVMVVDRDEERINAVADAVTHAVQADGTDEQALKALGVRNFDAAVVAIGSDIQSSILITLLLKEHGLPLIVAKAQSEHHAKVLYRIGADRVILPERDMGQRVALGLVSSGMVELTELSEDFSITEREPDPQWLGRSLWELSLPETHQVTVVGIRRSGTLLMNIDSDTRLEAGDSVLLFGISGSLKKPEPQ